MRVSARSNPIGPVSPPSTAAIDAGDVKPLLSVPRVAYSAEAAR